MKIHILSKFYKQFFKNGNNFRKDILISDMNKYLETGDISNSTNEFKEFIFDYVANLDNDQKFAMGLMSDFPRKNYPKILEVACGNNFKLSEFLAKNGYEVTAIDQVTNINNPLNEYRIKFLQSSFICDDVAGKGKGTNIKEYDFLVGIRPCGATEHIIRQSLNYDKPFNVMLCNCTKSSIYGEHFGSKDDWYNYLESISKEVKIVPENGFHYITNLDKVHTEFMKTIHVEYDFFE